MPITRSCIRSKHRTCDITPERGSLTRLMASTDSILDAVCSETIEAPAPSTHARPTGGDAKAQTRALALRPHIRHPKRLRSSCHRIMAGQGVSVIDPHSRDKLTVANREVYATTHSPTARLCSSFTSCPISLRCCKPSNMLARTTKYPYAGERNTHKLRTIICLARHSPPSEDTCGLNIGLVQRSKRCDRVHIYSILC